MKKSAIFRLAILLPLLALIFSCAPKVPSEPTAEIYQLEGMEAPVYYAAPKPLSDGDKGELAVIMIQGWGGGVQVLKEQLALQKSLGDVYVVSPLYPRTQVMEKHNIAKDDRAIWNESWPRDLTIPGTPHDDWRGGGDANGTTMSSYDVVDELLAQLSYKKLFPNLKKIVMVGFSAGGQFVGRYVAVGKGVVREGITLEYAAMAPSTFLWPSSTDTWHYGISNRPRYCRETSDEQMMENLRSRRCLHGCGSLDVGEGSLDKTPPAMKQGENRFVRYLNFKAMVEKDEKWAEKVVFHTFDSIAHKAIKAYDDPVFVEYVKEIK
jgi:dienelactone hydrolase